jgi:hypothetical protein
MSTVTISAPTYSMKHFKLAKLDNGTHMLSAKASTLETQGWPGHKEVYLRNPASKANANRSSKVFFRLVSSGSEGWHYVNRRPDMKDLYLVISND